MCQKNMPGKAAVPTKSAVRPGTPKQNNALMRDLRTDDTRKQTSSYAAHRQDRPHLVADDGRVCGRTDCYVDYVLKAWGWTCCQCQLKNQPGYSQCQNRASSEDSGAQ